MQVPLKLSALDRITHAYETCDHMILGCTGRSVCFIVWFQVPNLSVAQQESARGTSYRHTVPSTPRHCYEQHLRDIIWRV